MNSQNKSPPQFVCLTEFSGPDERRRRERARIEADPIWVQQLGLDLDTFVDEMVALAHQPSASDEAAADTADPSQSTVRPSNSHQDLAQQHPQDSIQRYTQVSSQQHIDESQKILILDGSMSMQSIGNHQNPNQQHSIDGAEQQHISGTQQTSTPVQTLTPFEYIQQVREFLNSRKSNGRRTASRHPWSPEEERVLLESLDAFGATRWADILALHGKNGTVSQVLEHRNQVALKDKARNLKTFLIVHNFSLPRCLAIVTGTEDTRASTHSAKRAEKKRKRTQQDENPVVTAEMHRFQPSVARNGYDTIYNKTANTPPLEAQNRLVTSTAEELPEHLINRRPNLPFWATYAAQAAWRDFEATRDNTGTVTGSSQEATTPSTSSPGL